MTIVIYADGNKEIGLGHLTRMRTLATRLGGSVRVLTRTPEEANSVFSGTNATVEALADGPLQERISRFADGASVVILDPPYHPEKPRECDGPTFAPLGLSLRQSGIPLIRFTDEERSSAHVCDLLINDHPLATEFADTYRKSDGVGHCLVGPRYFLIDPTHETADAAEGGLFVSFGGSDQGDLLLRFLEPLKKLSEHLPVHAIAGPASRFPAASVSGITVSNALAPDRFSALLKGARLVLSAAGNTLFERIYHARPGLSIAQFARQDQTGRAFEGLGLTRHLGLGTALAPGRLVDAVLGFLAEEAAMTAQSGACRTLDIAGGCREIVAAVAAVTERA